MHSLRGPAGAPATLEEGSFTLRPLTPDDVDDRYVGWLNDPDVNRFLEVRFARQTTESVRRFVSTFYGDNEKYIWGVYPDGQREFVGTTTIYAIDRNHLTAEWGLMIGDRQYWGRHASEGAMQLVADYAFGTLGLRRLVGGSYATNVGINFLYRTSGWTREGVLRRAARVGPGEYVDLYRWGILSEEWRARRHAAREA